MFSTTSQSVPSKEALVELSAAIMQAAGVRVVHISGTDDQSVNDLIVPSKELFAGHLYCTVQAPRGKYLSLTPTYWSDQRSNQ